MADLSDKQQEVIDQINELLREHFEASVLIVQTQEPEHDDEEFELLYYHGGRATALGMIMLARNTVLNRQFEEEEDEG